MSLGAESGTLIRGCESAGEELRVFNSLRQSSSLGGTAHWLLQSLRNSLG